MKEEIKQAVSDVAQHPKAASIAVAGLTTTNVWFVQYEPVLKVVTSVLGIVLVSVLIVNHCIDIYRKLKNK